MSVNMAYFHVIVGNCPVYVIAECQESVAFFGSFVAVSVHTTSIVLATSRTRSFRMSDFEAFYFSTSVFHARAEPFLTRAIKANVVAAWEYV